MLNLLKNVSIEFQACLNILNKLYKINKKRNILQENEDGPKDTTVRYIINIYAFTNI